MFGRRTIPIKAGAVILAAGLVLSGCGKKETKSPDKEKTGSKSSTTTEYEPEESSTTDPDTGAGSSAAGSATTAPGTSETFRIDAKLWSAEIPKHFLYSKGSCIDTESESKFDFYGDLNHQDFDYVLLSIVTEDFSEFTKNHQYSFSMEDYSKGKLPTTQIGGYPFISYETMHFGSEIDLDETTYLYRDEKSSMTVRIVVQNRTMRGEWLGDDFLSNIEFHLPDLGLSDPPFSFESGEHQTQVKETNLGEYTISPTQSCFSEHVFVQAIGGIVSISYTACHATASEKYLYTLDIHSEILYVYEITDTEMKRVAAEPIGKESATIALPDGDRVTYYLNPEKPDEMFFIENVDGKEFVFEFEELLAVSPDGKTILHSNLRGELQYTLHVDPKTKEVTTEPFVLELPSFDSDIFLQQIIITDNSIFVEIEPAVGNDVRTFEFDRDGKLIRELKNGSEPIHPEHISALGEDLLIVDGHADSFLLLDKDRNVLASVPINETLGISDDELDIIFLHYSFAKINDNGDYILVYAYNNGGLLEDLVFRFHIEK